MEWLLTEKVGEMFVFLKGVIADKEIRGKVLDQAKAGAKTAFGFIHKVISDPKARAEFVANVKARAQVALAWCEEVAAGAKRQAKLIAAIISLYSEKVVEMLGVILDEFKDQWQREQEPKQEQGK